MPVTIGLGVASPDERILSTIQAVGGEVDLVLFPTTGSLLIRLGVLPRSSRLMSPRRPSLQPWRTAGSVPPSGAACLRPPP